MKIERVIKLHDDENKNISVGDYVVVKVDNMKEKEYRGIITDIKDIGMHLKLDNGYTMIILFKYIISLNWRPY